MNISSGRTRAVADRLAGQPLTRVPAGQVGRRPHAALAVTWPEHAAALRDSRERGARTEAVGQRGSISDDYHALERQSQLFTGIDGVELIPRALVASHRRPAGPVLEHHAEHEVLGIHDETGSDEISVIRVPAAPRPASTSSTIPRPGWKSSTS